MTEKDSPTCFMAMPVTTRDPEAERYRDDEHWAHVMSTLFVPAIEAAGMTPLYPTTVGAHLIHFDIISKLVEADLVLVDLSYHNPNVFFELGVRTSMNLPVSLVHDEVLDLPFDTSGINTLAYDGTLAAWDLEETVDALAQHLRDCVETSGGGNPLWQRFGIQAVAAAPSATASSSEAKMDLILSMVTDLQETVYRDERRLREVQRAVLSPAVTWADLEANAASGLRDLRAFAHGDPKYLVEEAGSFARARNIEIIESTIMSPRGDAAAAGDPPHVIIRIPTDVPAALVSDLRAFVAKKANDYNLLADVKYGRSKAGKERPL